MSRSNDERKEVGLHDYSKTGALEAIHSDKQGAISWWSTSSRRLGRKAAGAPGRKGNSGRVAIKLRTLPAQSQLLSTCEIQAEPTGDVVRGEASQHLHSSPSEMGEIALCSAYSLLVQDSETI
ncbi:unnamed protein product [Heligmosomoides polygyrus]|uniref:Uncharacterized protein n=1 Tax=Heligmosomoides polygyrus TaxID=6339 RepID=A0A183FY82_HELPZ|nr:unnamed protein product [Heligmosomoides polygyrus]